MNRIFGLLWLLDLRFSFFCLLLLLLEKGHFESIRGTDFDVLFKEGEAVVCSLCEFGKVDAAFDHRYNSDDY